MDIQSILPLVSPTTPQANTNLLLQLKVGQVIPATVIKALPNNGQAQLNIGGKLVQAQSNNTLHPGQILALEVVETGRQPQLKIVQIVRPIAQETISQKALLSNIGLQKSPIQLPRQLIAFSKTPIDTNTLPTAIKTLAQNFLTKLPSIHELSTFQGIKQAIGDSGIFLEAKLSRFSQHKSAPIENDLKANLLRFASGVEQESPSRETVRYQKPERLATPSETETGLNLNRILIESAKGAVSKIILDQISSLPEDHGIQQTWNLEIPFLNSKKAEVVKLTIQHEAPNRQNTKDAHWSIVVEINPPNLGTLQCKIMMSNTRVNAYFRTESESTHQLIQDNLNLLKQQLTKSGLAVGNLSSGGGLTKEKPLHSHVSNILDQHA